MANEEVKNSTSPEGAQSENEDSFSQNFDFISLVNEDLANSSRLWNGGGGLLERPNDLDLPVLEIMPGGRTGREPGIDDKPSSDKQGGSGHRPEEKAKPDSPRTRSSDSPDPIREAPSPTTGGASSHDALVPKGASSSNGSDVQKQK